MDPILEDPSLKAPRPLNQMSEAERQLLLHMSPMDKVGWAPESFRDGPWGAADDPQHPWHHEDVPGFLGKLGFGSVYSMPEILDAKQAKKLADTWRKEVWNAWTPLNAMIRRDGDLALNVLANEDILPDHEISSMISRSWDQVKNSELYKPLFGQSAATENAPEGYQDYRRHWRGTVPHDCKADAQAEPGQKPDKASWTRPLLDVKAKEPGPYNDFVGRNTLALTIPWLHPKYLLNRHSLWKVIMDRSCVRPYHYSRSDWLVSHLAHSTHLVVPPYRDAWFMGFPTDAMGKKHWRSLEHFGTKYLDVDGSQPWHGLDIMDPSPEELRMPLIEDLRDAGLLFGWGQGLLLLQCQGAICRFIMTIVPLIMDKLKYFPARPTKVLKPLRSDDFYANDTEKAGPPPPPGYDLAQDGQMRQAALVLLERHHLRKFDTNKMGWQTLDNPDFRPPRTNPRLRALMWRDYTISIYKSLAELRHDPVFFQEFFTGVMDAHPGGVPESEVAAASWVAKKKRKKSKKKRGGAGNTAETQGSSSAPAGDDAPAAGEEPETAPDKAGVVRVLGHITSTDIEAKKSLVNDVLRRGIRAMIYQLEIAYSIQQLFQDLADATRKESKSVDQYTSLMDPLPGPESQAAWVALLVHLRRFSEILKSMFVDEGTLHSSPWVRQNFQRDTSNGEWESKASAGQSQANPWALPRNFLPFDQVRFTRNKGLYQRDEQALYDDLDLLTHGDGTAAGFVGIWRLVHDMADNLEGMMERGYFDSRNTRGLLNSLRHVLRWSRILETIRPLRVDPAQYEIMLKQSKHAHFFSVLDDFNFEAGVNPKNLRDVQWLLGVRYADDDTPPKKFAEARKCLRAFWEDIDRWIEYGRRSAKAYVDGLSRLRNPEKHLSIEEQRQAIKDGKTDPVKIARRDARQFVVRQICGHISTLKPRPAAPVVAQPEPAALPPEVVAAVESIEQSNKKWILERFGGDGKTAPGRSQPPKNPNHEENEVYRAKTRTRLTQSDWTTVDRTFGHGTGSIRWQDWCRLVTHMGFQMQPQGGSMFRFSYTSASRLPNGQGTPGWSDHTTTHMQHGTGNATLLPHVARSYAARFETSFQVTRDAIAAAYGTEADPDPVVGEDGTEDVEEESEGERKRNRKRRRQKEKFQAWLEAQPSADVGDQGRAEEPEVPMANFAADDEEAAEVEDLDIAGVDINAMLARLAEQGHGGRRSSGEKRRAWEEGEEEEDDEPAEAGDVEREYFSAPESKRLKKRVRFT